MSTILDPAAAERLGPFVRSLMVTGKDLNQRQLAEKAGVSLATVNNLINAKTKLPHVRTIRKIALALDTTPQKLLAAVTSDAALPPDQQQLVSLFVRKSRSDQRLVLTLLRRLPDRLKGSK